MFFIVGFIATGSVFSPLVVLFNSEGPFPETNPPLPAAPGAAPDKKAANESMAVMAGWLAPGSDDVGGAPSASATGAVVVRKLSSAAVAGC